MKALLVKLLNIEHLPEILVLTKQLNENIPVIALKEMQIEMFKLDTYKCFGLFSDNKLIGISSGWITVRLYSGKQLEIDNVIVNSSMQSKGYGSKFIKEIELWAKENACKTIELNTYVQNDRSHKFYFKQGFNILGFHFQKKIEE